VAGACAAVAVPPAAQAAPRDVKAGLPRAGDVTLVSMKFARSASRSRRLPRLALAPGKTRRVLKRYGVAVVGGSFRISKRQVVGAAVLMRKRGARGGRTPRAAVASPVANAPATSVTVERNAIADLRRARASGEQANAPTVCGETGLFSLLAGDKLPPGSWSFSLYYNDWDRLIEFSDRGLERPKEEELTMVELVFGMGCEKTELIERDKQGALDDFIKSLGAPLPGPDCTFLTTYIGPATDGQGNILTPPAVSSSIQCTSLLNSVTLSVPNHTPIRCEDSAGNDCTIRGDEAVFPFLLTPFESRGYNLVTDPPLERGDRLELELDSNRGDLNEQQVM